MHVTARRVALCGLLLAFSVICMVLGSVLRPIRAVSAGRGLLFCGDRDPRVWAATGAAFYLASVLLGFLTAPQQILCDIIFRHGAVYPGTEALYRLMAGWPSGRCKSPDIYGARYALFNLMFLPVTAGFWHSLFSRFPRPCSCGRR